MNTTLKEQEKQPGQEELKKALKQFKQGMSQLRGALGHGGSATSSLSSTGSQVSSPTNKAQTTTSSTSTEQDKEGEVPAYDEATQEIANKLSPQEQQSFKAVYDAAHKNNKKINPKAVADIITTWDSIGLKVIPK